MSLEIIIVFESLQDPLKINFSANMAATCPQLGPQHAPKLGPKWCQNRSWRPMGPHGPPWSPSEPSLDRIWLDFGTIFDRFWVDFVLILYYFFVVFVACWVHMSTTIWDIFGYSCGISTEVIFERVLVGSPLPSNTCCRKLGAGGRGRSPLDKSRNDAKQINEITGRLGL